MPEEFRVTVFGEPRAPWRHSRDAALKDAIRLDLASWDRSKREWFLAVPVDVERRGRPDHPEPHRRDRSRAPWTDDEIDQLRRLATARESSDMIALRLGRTPEAIRSKARASGIAIRPGTR